MEVYQKMANFVGTFLNINKVPYTFVHKVYDHHIAVEYTCNDHLITINFAAPLVWGRIQKGALLGRMYILTDKLEDFKREIRAKCILK
jgi:hypothetical protein